ncbi:MAG: FAD-dependent oxidoreductase [Planctomycetaceae bacterium]|nr:FAD-dependent oxidoreductase [Planctomycetaceae bacterium]
MSESRDRVVVVGGGVVGAACAYYLAQSGFSVTIIDQKQFGSACSHANCGYVSPSHILPLCRPGAVGNALKTMFQKNSPFKMRFRLDPSLWSWLLSFARHCNEKDMYAAGFARQALLDSSKDLYRDLITGGTLTDCEWQELGLLFVFKSQSHFEHYRETDQLLREKYGLGAKAYPEQELLELEPALKPGVAGAFLYECDAHLRPDKLMSAWKRRLFEDGVEILENCTFQGFDRSRGKVGTVQTSTGPIAAEQVVVATGAWTPLLKNQLHKALPIQPGKGYSITMNRPAVCPKYPMIFEEHRVAITPMDSVYRVGSTMEFAGYDTSLNEQRFSLLTEGAKLYLKDPLGEPVLEKWYGWRPMSSDGVPFIGKLPAYQNVWVAAGHSMLGLSMGSGTGKLISELITGAVPHVDPAAYRVDR